VEVGDEPDAAGVVLVPRVVQALGAAGQHAFVVLFVVGAPAG
jgi:hypothetical protein